MSELNPVIFVVMGSTGEYSDHVEWPVRAFLDEAVAKEHVAKATQRANELMAAYKYRHQIPDGANEHDPEMQVDCTGVNYYIMDVELGGRAPDPAVERLIEAAGRIGAIYTEPSGEDTLALRQAISDMLPALAALERRS